MEWIKENKWTVRVFTLVMAPVMALSLFSGCGMGAIDTDSPLHNPLFTGGFDPMGRPFVAGPMDCLGERCFQDDKNQMIPQEGESLTAAELRNQELANSVLSAQLERFDAQTAQGGADSAEALSRRAFRGQQSYRLQVQILEGGQLEPSILYFVGHLQSLPESSVFELSPASVASPQGVVYQISGQIVDTRDHSSSEAKDITLGQIQLKQISGVQDTSGVLAETTLYYRSYPARVRLREKVTQSPTSEGGRPSSGSSELDGQLQKLRQTERAQFHQWAIPMGPAYYSVDILDSEESKETSPQSEEKVLFTILGPSLASGIPTPVQASGLSASQLQVGEVTLFGNPEDKDITTFQVELMTSQPQVTAPTASVQVILEIDGDHELEPSVEFIREEEKGASLQGSTFRGAKAQSFLRSNLSDSNIRRAVEQLEANYSLSGVQRAIAQLSKRGSGSRAGQLERFMRFSAPFRPLLEDTFNHYQVPPPMAYITVVESSFFTSGHYDIQVAANEEESATGPFQFQHGTARDRGLHVDRERNPGGQLPSVQDGRRYLIPSTCGAASYLQEHMRAFPKDATLAILAYNLGRGGTNQVIRPIRDYDYSFREVVRRRLLPDTSKLDYVYRVLALYFVAGDPEKYGFDRALVAGQGSGSPSLRELTSRTPRVVAKGSSQQVSMFLPPAGTSLGPIWSQCGPATQAFRQTLINFGATQLAHR